MTKKELIDKVLSFWTEDKYCKYHLAISPNSKVTYANDPSAFKWCALGILRKFTWEVDLVSLGEQVAIDFYVKYGGFLGDSNDLGGYELTIKRLKELYN